MKATHSRRFSSVSRFLALAGALGLATPLPTAPGQAGGPRTPLLPPGAGYRGRTLAEWSFLANQMNLENLKAGQDVPDTIDRVRLLPDSFEPGLYEFDLELGPQTALAESPFYIIGELYDDGTYDDPDELAGLIDYIFETTSIDIWLDGRLVLSGTADEMAGRQYGLLEHHPPIYYTEPEPRGEDVNAVAAIWTTGVGTIYLPLPPGRHTMFTLVDSEFFGQYGGTLNITVGPLWSRPGEGPFGPGASE